MLTSEERIGEGKDEECCDEDSQTMQRLFCSTLLKHSPTSSVSAKSA